MKILAEEQGSAHAQSILSRVGISVNKHESRCIALVAHYDCAGNPVGEHVQRQQLQVGTKFLAEHYPDVSILALWVDSDWVVHDVPIAAC